MQTAIERIHIEEDAGKLTHEGNQTLIDYNRCGIGLIEIVSRPTIRSGEEAAAYLRALRAVLVAIGVSDCKMQEGSMRCDVNVSVRPRGQSHLGVRTEIKNLNSFAFVEKAISYEIERHCQLLEQGEPVVMETRRFEPAVGKTFPLRSKERVSDYRFLLEPDLPVLSVHKSEIERIRCTLPELPRARAARLSRTYGIAQQDAAVLVSDAALAEYFEAVAACTRAPGIALHMILTDLLRLQAEEHFTTTVLPERLGELADLLVDGVINSTTAKKLLLRLTEGDFSPVQVIEREDLAQVRDEATLCAVVEGVLAENLRAVKDYCHGKKAAMRALQGQAMAKTRGRADPVRLERILTERLEAIRETEESI